MRATIANGLPVSGLTDIRDGAIKSEISGGGTNQAMKICKNLDSFKKVWHGKPPPENFEILELIWCILAYIQEDFSSKWGLSTK